jgi:phosphoribosyl 1,2-cyclic phosphodiesterase
MSLSMDIEFWGVRGSIPVPGPTTVRYGGNTSCVLVRLSGGDLVFDAGTGIRELGRAMMKAGCPSRIDVFLSHVHWDHIQGFPFFAPAMKKGVKIGIHGMNSLERTLESVVEGQMEGPTFPIGLKQMGADIDFEALEAGAILPLENEPGKPWASVSCAHLNHPNGVYGYRVVEASTGVSFVYATDTEHVEGKIDRTLVRLAQGADVLVYDGMFTDEEYPTRRGWGHSTWREGFKVAMEAGVKTFVVFHHDPARTDDAMDELKAKVTEEAKRLDPSIAIEFAREGLSLRIGDAG